MAEDNLYGEVAVVLSMTREEAKAFIEEKVEERVLKWWGQPQCHSYIMILRLSHSYFGLAIGNI